MSGTHYYKYRSLSNLRYFLDILIHKRLYLASYDELNDPIEGAFVAMSKSDSDKEWFENLRSEKNDIRICSLSRNYKSTLMWAHYADSNRGCCIECEVKSSSELVEEVPVEYVKKVKSVVRMDLIQAAKLILSRKLECWKYEDEIRFLKHVPPKSNKKKYLNITIHRIYLGIKMPRKERDFYKALIQSIDSSIKVVAMKKNDLKY